MPRVYLDTCCLNRPFDDQTQDRIRLEAEAVRLILLHIEHGDWEWVTSEVLAYEIDQVPDNDRRSVLRQWLTRRTHSVELTETVIERGEALKDRGFHRYDALHLASAEHGAAEAFLTTDDRLLRTAIRNERALFLEVANPNDWLARVERNVAENEDA